MHSKKKVCYAHVDSNCNAMRLIANMHRRKTNCRCVLLSHAPAGENNNTRGGIHVLRFSSHFCLSDICASDSTAYAWEQDENKRRVLCFKGGERLHTPIQVCGSSALFSLPSLVMDVQEKKKKKRCMIDLRRCVIACIFLSSLCNHFDCSRVSWKVQIYRTGSSSIAERSA